MDANLLANLSARAARPTLRGHIAILRMDHWFKNAFALPGVAVALSAEPQLLDAGLPLRLLAGLSALCLITSSNYVLNEVLDAPFDRLHPTKHRRPVPLGLVNEPLAYVQWIALMAIGLWLGFSVARGLGYVLLALWVMGCVYNIPPIRSKDVPYVDVLSESVNNPLRMLAGWYLVGTLLIPPASLLLSYWMVGCYFMTLKRYAEYRHIRNAECAQAYRRVFLHYTEERLLVATMFCAALAMLFLGAFVIRYRLELMLAFPFVALVMAEYLRISFRDDSPVQRPEGLYREPRLMAEIAMCVAVLGTMLFIDVPKLHALFAPTIPVIR